MGKMKTILLVVSLALPVQAGTLPLAPQPGEEQLFHFATCSGRFSALMEHQWMVDGPQSEVTRKYLEEMVSLVQALAPDDQGARVMSWRIDAKVVQRDLLMRAEFGASDAERTHALARSDQLIGSCRSLLLG